MTPNASRSSTATFGKWSLSIRASPYSCLAHFEQNVANARAAKQQFDMTVHKYVNSFSRTSITVAASASTKMAHGRFPLGHTTGCPIWGLISYNSSTLNVAERNTTNIYLSQHNFTLWRSRGFIISSLKIIAVKYSTFVRTYLVKRTLPVHARVSLPT